MRAFRLALGLSLLLPLSCGRQPVQKVTVAWWQFWTSPDVKPTIAQMVKDFEAANPNIAVELGDLTWSDGHEKIAIALAAGSGPDVIELGSDWIPEFVASGKVFDLTDSVAGLRESLVMWEPAVYGGRCYAVPWMLGTRVLFCNRTLLRQAGYESNFVPTTWKQLLEASTRIDNLGEDVFGFASNSAERHRLYKKFLPFFWSAGGEVFNADRTATKFNSDAGLRSLEYYIQLSSTGLLETQSRLEEYFAAGKVGFIISGEWFIKKLERMARTFDYFVTTMPSPTPDSVGISFAGGEYLAVNAASKNLDGAIRLIRHLVQPKQDTLFARATGSFTPVNVRSIMEYDSKLSKIAAVFQRQLRHSKPTPAHPGWVAIEEILEKGIEQALYRRLTAAEALQAIDAECALVLKRNGNE